MWNSIKTCCGSLGKTFYSCMSIIRFTLKIDILMKKTI